MGWRPGANVTVGSSECSPPLPRSGHQISILTLPTASALVGDRGFEHCLMVGTGLRSWRQATGSATDRSAHLRKPSQGF